MFKNGPLKVTGSEQQMKKHLFKNICENSLRQTRVYGIWTRTAPSLSPASLARQRLYSRLMQPRMESSPPLNTHREGFFLEEQNASILSCSQLPVAEAVSGKCNWEVGFLLLPSPQSQNEGSNLGHGVLRILHLWSVLSRCEAQSHTGKGTSCCFSHHSEYSAPRAGMSVREKFAIVPTPFSKTPAQGCCLRGRNMP